MKHNCILILAILLIVIGCNGENQMEKIKFNQKKWLHGDQRIRGKMVDDIINDSILMGKTKREVLSLLGDQGDTTGNFSYAVDLGLKTGPFGLGGAWLFGLNIHFDSLNQKVIEVRCND